MRRLSTFIATALLAGALLVGTLQAYAFLGGKWPTSQVLYKINPSNLYVTPDAAIAALSWAASAWSTQANPNVQLVYAGTTTTAAVAVDYQNVVFFRNDSNGYAAAETYTYWDGSGNMLDSDIVFHEASYVFFTGTSGCSGNGEYLEDVGTHEFGHMLGMAHSTDPTATMYPYNNYCGIDWRYLAQDDIDGIQALYPATNTTSMPAAPSQLTASDNSASPSNSLMLSWVDNASNASGYRVERSADGVSFAQIAQLGSSANGYTDSGLAAGATYSYRVSAYNAAGTSAYSNTASAQTVGISVAPTSPASPSPADGATATNTNVTLAWSSISAQTYDVYFGTTSSPGLSASNLTNSSVSMGSLASGTTYYWQVVAKNNIGATPGPVWSFTTKTTSTTTGKGVAKGRKK